MHTILITPRGKGQDRYRESHMPFADGTNNLNYHAYPL